MSLLAISSPAAAGGDHGHRIVCEIAFRLAEPETRAEIRRLLREDPKHDFFSDSCLWADKPFKRRDKEHYVNFPRNTTKVTSLACPPGDPCILEAIASDLKKLADKSQLDEVRLDALKFLGHWIGDLHQPLHVSLKGDSGGNDIEVTGVACDEMHGLWDTCLVAASVKEDVREAAKELIATITPLMQEQWVQSEVHHWASESLKVTREPTTKYCILQAGTAFCSQPSGQVHIDTAYVNDHKAIIRERLAKAGVRLAHLLNQALSN
ncbi:MAG TPA: S1/P1 nuclease [Aestuariivirgaceae bacterium]|nr:S1/P1 nuclease [Aestuariivirgaceae bacterium]